MMKSVWRISTLNVIIVKGQYNKIINFLKIIFLNIINKNFDISNIYYVAQVKIRMLFETLMKFRERCQLMFHFQEDLTT